MTDGWRTIGIPNLAAVRFADYVSTDDGVATAGQLTEDDIIQDVTGADDDDPSEDYDCGELPQPPKRTVKEAAEALSVLEDFCELIRHDACTTEHQAAIRAIAASQVCPEKSDYYYKLLWQIKVL